MKNNDIFIDKMQISIEIDASRKSKTEQLLNPAISPPATGHADRHDPIWVQIHDDDCGAVLDDGICPLCKFPPDMQSRAFEAQCRYCKISLEKGGHCIKCRRQFDTKFR